MSQGYRSCGEAMCDNDRVIPSEHRDADDDTGTDPDDTADPAAAVARDGLVALGEQESDRNGDADAAQSGVLERQRLHRSRRAHESGRDSGKSGEIAAWGGDDGQGG